MAKSLRSKVKKRWRSLKRNYLSEVAVKPHLQQLSKKLQATIVGVQYRQEQKVNAFLNPNDPKAQFPQWAPKKMIDLRSTSIPGSGRQYAGASRKHMTKTLKINDNNQNQMSQQDIQQQIKIDRSLMKKDKNKKSKIKKTIVF